MNPNWTTDKEFNSCVIKELTSRGYSENESSMICSAARVQYKMLDLEKAAELSSQTDYTMEGVVAAGTAGILTTDMEGNSSGGEGILLFHHLSGSLSACGKK